MATFPTWINNNNNKKTANTPALSPRQIANKAYTLAIKKLDKDSKRKRPQYSVREKLLLSNTITKAEEILNKKSNIHGRMVSFDDDDVMPPFNKKSETTTTTTAPKQEPKKEQEPLPIVVVAVTYQPKKMSSFVSHDFCRPMLLPTHTLTTTII